MPFWSKKSPATYNDDFFADTRMSFGDHIEELRAHLIRAIVGLLVVLFGALALDGIGWSMGSQNFGVGRPVLKLIIDPAENEVRAFYARRNDKAVAKLPTAPADPAEIERVLAKWEEVEHDTSKLSDAEMAVLRAVPVEMPVVIPVKVFADAFGIKPLDPARTEVEVRIKVIPAWLHFINNRGETLLENRQYMRTQNVQEGMVVYFKVLLLCSVVIGSPWLFYQLWSFVAAGLYPHERAYVYKFLGPSIGLFLLGVSVCQFLVLSGAVKALLGFNNWVELDPDLRLTEWLSFALILPLIFGVSFQTPLVMFFFNRIGTFTAADYLAKWRHAFMGLAVFAAVITPTQDPITMMYLFVPMFGLYMLGIAVCHFFPPAHETAWEDEEQQVAV